MSDRLIKLNELIKEEISNIIKNQIELGDEVFLTVVSVNTSSTLEHAAVRISVFPEVKTEEILRKLNNQIFGIQQALNKRLTLRKVPKIRFEIDGTEKYAAHIEGILKELEK